MVKINKHISDIKMYKHYFKKKKPTFVPQIEIIMARQIIIYKIKKKKS